MSDKLLNRLSAILTIICAPASIASYHLDISPILTISLLILAGFFGVITWYYWNKAKNKKPDFKEVNESLSDIAEHAPYRDDYELVYHKTSIDIGERDGSKSYCQQTNVIKCLKLSSYLYYFRYVPDKYYTDFKFSPGIIESMKTRSNGTDIIVQFDRPCNLNETKEIVINSRIVGLLSDPEEYWCVQKYYKSTAIILEIKFPVGYIPKTHKTEIVINDMYPKARTTKRQAASQMVDKRYILTISTDELRIGEKLRLSWTW